jgi:DNA-binding response OmpR family regulator
LLQILLIEDEHKIALFVGEGPKEQGFVIDIARMGIDAQH